MPMKYEPAPRWSVRLFSESTHRFHVPAAPRWHWRVMQYIVLGIVWERLDAVAPLHLRVLRSLRELWG